MMNYTSDPFTDSNGDSLTLTQTGLPAPLVFTDNGDGTYTVTGPAPAGGPWDVYVTADDGNSGTATQILTIDCGGSVNAAPIANGNPPADQTISDGDAITPLDFSTCFSDTDGDTLSFNLSPTLVGLSVDAATGIVTGTPTGLVAPWPNVITVTVQADDGNGGTATCSADLTVEEMIASSAIVVSGAPEACGATGGGKSSLNFCMWGLGGGSVGNTTQNTDAQLPPMTGNLDCCGEPIIAFRHFRYQAGSYGVYGNQGGSNVEPLFEIFHASGSSFPVFNNVTITNGVYTVVLPYASAIAAGSNGNSTGGLAWYSWPGRVDNPSSAGVSFDNIPDPLTQIMTGSADYTITVNC